MRHPLTDLRITYIAPDIIFNSLAESAELLSYVNQGVVIIPEFPT